MRGMFIAFEGMDGAGKSTQIRFISEYMRGKGLEVLVTREPGGCDIAESVREILLSNGSGAMGGRCEALLYAAARAQHVDEVIRPAVMAGSVVICDRFLLSSLAYQGYGRGVALEDIRALNAFATGGLMPDKTFFLYIGPERAFERMNEHKVRDRIENEGLDFHRRVFDGFLELAGADPSIVLIDASGTKYETHDKIVEEVDALFKRA